MDAGFWLGKLREKAPLRIFGRRLKDNIKVDFQERMWWLRLDWSGLEYWQVMGFCEQGSDLLAA